MKKTEGTVIYGRAPKKYYTFFLNTIYTAYIVKI